MAAKLFTRSSPPVACLHQTASTILLKAHFKSRKDVRIRGHDDYRRGGPKGGNQAVGAALAPAGAGASLRVLAP